MIRPVSEILREERRLSSKGCCPQRTRGRSVRGKRALEEAERSRLAGEDQLVDFELDRIHPLGKAGMREHALFQEAQREEHV